MSEAKILWLTGNSESGKTTLAQMFYNRPLPENTVPPYTLKMNDTERDIYDRICGPTLKKLGY